MFCLLTWFDFWIVSTVYICKSFFCCTGATFQAGKITFCSNHSFLSFHGQGMSPCISFIMYILKFTNFCSGCWKVYILLNFLINIYSLLIFDVVPILLYKKNKCLSILTFYTRWRFFMIWKLFFFQPLPYSNM